MRTGVILKYFLWITKAEPGGKMHPKTLIILMKKVIPKKGYSEKELDDFLTPSKIRI